MLAVFAVPAMAQTQTETSVKNNGLIPYENLKLEGYTSELTYLNNSTKKEIIRQGGTSTTDELGSNKYCGEITVPSGVTTLYSESGSWGVTFGTFQYSYITSVTLPASVTSFGQGAFADCPYLTYIDVDDANTTFFDDNGVVYQKKADGTYALVAVPGAREKITILEGTTEIADCAFDGCFRITNVTIPATVTKIGIYAFTGSGIETITCLNPTPPEVDGRTSGFIKDHGFIKMLNEHKNITVYVPAESVNAYKAHADWKDFSVQAIATPGVDETTFKVAMTLVETKNTKGEVTAVKEIHVYGANNETLATLPNEWTLTYEGTVYSTANNNMTVAWDTANKIVCLTFGTAPMNAEGEYKLNIPAGSLKTSDGKECLEANFYYIIQAPEVVQKELLHAVILNITDSDAEYSWKYTNSNGETVANVTEHTIGSTLYTEETRYTDATENVTTITNHIYYSAEAQYARTFKNTEWQALYVPFAIDYSVWSDQFEVAEITGVYDNGADSEIMFYVLGEVLESGSTVANTPYLIRAKTASETTPKVLQIASRKTIDAPEENTLSYTVNGNTYKITGQYTKSAYTNDGRTFAMAGGALKQPAQNKSVTLGACRWVLTIDAANSGATFSFGRFDNDGTTGIEEVTTENANVKGIYDLQGRKIDEITKPGLYIVDGVKKLVK